MAEEIISTCIPLEPFIKLQEGGQAAELNYLLPQKTEMTLYGFIPLIKPKVGNDPFNQDAYEVPLPAEVPTISGLIDEIIQGGGSYVRPDVAEMLKEALLTAPAVFDQGGSRTSSTEFIQTRTYKSLVLNTSDLPAALTEIHAAYGAGKMPAVIEHLGGFKRELTYVDIPSQAQPTFFVMEEYKIASYLGDYGAGKTLSTFSLLPGEKVSITLESFRESTSKKAKSENVIDSFSSSSTNEFEKEMSKETGESETTNSKKSLSASVNAKIGVVNVRVDGSMSAEKTRATNTNQSSKALERHVQNSNANREVNINTSAEESYTESNKEIIQREIVNPNLTCTANYVFRQLLQEYIVINYLNDIKIGFSNGFDEMTEIVDVSEIDYLMEKYCKDETAAAACKTLLINQCMHIRSKVSGCMEFLEEVTPCGSQPASAKYHIKRPDLIDSYELSETRSIEVPGVILNVSKQVLRTDSVIVDTILGQGLALDCFNMKMQDGAAEKVRLENVWTQTKISSVTEITDPVERAAAIQKIEFAPSNNIITS